MSFTVGSKMRFLKSFIACGTLQYDISFEAFILHFEKLLNYQKCEMKKSFSIIMCAIIIPKIDINIVKSWKYMTVYLKCI